MKTKTKIFRRARAQLLVRSPRPDWMTPEERDHMLDFWRDSARYWTRAIAESSRRGEVRQAQQGVLDHALGMVRWADQWGSCPLPPDPDWVTAAS